jgi:hypothetical protein
MVWNYWLAFHFFFQSDVHLIHKDEKVGASEATLLQMLKIYPFSYGLDIQQGEWSFTSLQNNRVQSGQHCVAPLVTVLNNGPFEMNFHACYFST